MKAKVEKRYIHILTLQIWQGVCTHHLAIKGISHLRGEVHLQGEHCYSEFSLLNICI